MLVHQNHIEILFALCYELNRFLCRVRYCALYFTPTALVATVASTARLVGKNVALA